MKQRMTILDIRAISNELNSKLANSFIQNFYSFEQRFIYIKMSNKDCLLIEPGARIHLSKEYESEISHFCKKLREKCRHARIHKIYQYGYDRVIIIDILRYRLAIEFFSGGNIIIIDENDVIVDLLRPVKDLDIVKGKKYIFNKVEVVPDYNQFVEKDLEDILPFEKEYIQIIKNEINELATAMNVEYEDLKNEKYKKEVDDYFINLMKRTDNLGGFGEVTLFKNKPLSLFAFKTVENAALVDQEKTATSKISDSNDSSLSKTLGNGLEDNHMENDKIEIADENNLDEANNEESKIDIVKSQIRDPVSEEDVIDRFKEVRLEPKYNVNYCDIEKVEQIICKHKNISALHFTSMSEASDFYFKDTKKQKKSKEDKGTRIKKAQEKYITQLGIQAISNQEIAEIMDENRDFINSVLETFKRVFETKMEWADFDVFWQQEKINENPIAQAIEIYDLRKKTCIINLDGTMIELDLNLNLSKNIEKYYQKRKKAIDKGNKTRVALDNIIDKLVPKKQVVKIQKRVPFWFEKFHFFISSDKTLVIGGKNSQQNELLVKKHLDPNDLYFHCEVHGASSVIAKGRSENTISQACYMSMCMSKCWDENVTRQVFYVEPNQVSKTTPTGEFISKGAFMIRGKKNIMNPYKLEYGVGILFKLKDSAEVLDFSVNPTSEDKIEFAMPVCAPWSVVEEYKYRVRICPGNEKKSKLCQDIMKKFHAISEDTPEECNVKAIGLDEYMSMVIGKSRLAKITK